MKIYLIGSLRNPEVPALQSYLTTKGHEVFASWYAAGEIADDRWQAYEQGRGLNLAQALKDYAAQNVFKFDKHHLNRCDAAVLLMPAGKSGHLELGYIIGQGKPGYVVFPNGEPDRWDVMLAFCDGICYNYMELSGMLDYARPNT